MPIASGTAISGTQEIDQSAFSAIDLQHPRVGEPILSGQEGIESSLWKHRDALRIARADEWIRNLYQVTWPRTVQTRLNQLCSANCVVAFSTC